MDHGTPEAKDDLPARPEEIYEAQLFVAGLRARRPLVTYALLASLAVLFGLEELWGGGSTATLVRMGAEVPSRVRSGEWWRLLVPMLLHGGIVHLLVNGFSLWMLGSFVERLLGHARYTILFVCSGLAGCLVGTYAVSSPKFGLSVGASGAVLGLLGAATVFGLWPRGQIPALIVRDLRKNALINFGLAAVISLRANVDYLGHIGGVLAGILLCGIGLLRPTIALSSRTRAGWGPLEPLVRALAVASALALVTAVGFALAHGRPWQLVQKVQLVNRPLGNTGVSIDVPALLSPNPPKMLEDNSKLYTFGDELSDGLWLTVVLAPPGSISREQGTSRMASRELEVAGLPARLTTFRSGGYDWHILEQRRPRYDVSLQLALAPDVPNNLKLEPTQLLEGLRDETKQ